MSLALLCFGLMLVLAADARADEIGVLDPIGWTGTYAGIRHGPSYADPPGSWVFVAEDDNRDTVNVVSEVPDQDDSEFYNAWHGADAGGEISGYARTAPYGVNGFNSARNWYDSALAYPLNSVQVGGYFRDELYLEIVGGSSAYLEFDFHVGFTLELLSEGESGIVPDGSFAKFQMNLLGYTGEAEWGPTFAMLDSFEGALEASGGTEYLVFDDTVTMATNANGHLLASGSFIPLSFTTWTYANNGEINWLNSVGLEDVRVYDADGNLLGLDQYTLRSPNDEFFLFQNEVPEPGSLLLFGVGLMGLAMFSRRLFKGRPNAS